MRKERGISAPTKLILTGEHAILYGVPAITIPISLFTTVTTKSLEKKEGIHISATPEISAEEQQWIQGMGEMILTHLPQDTASAFAAHISFAAPLGAGLGVSASLAVALTKAIFAFYDQPLLTEMLFEIVEKLEEKSHGKASGIDHLTLLHETPLFFSPAEREIQPLDINSSIFEKWLLVHTGKPEESTAEMVALVNQQVKNSAMEMKRIFDELRVQGQKIKNALETSQQKEFQEAIQHTGLLLEGMGIVSREVQKFSDLIRQNGGIAKVSGAGGVKGAGSGMLLVWHEDKEWLKNLCRENTFSFWQLSDLILQK